MVYRSWGEGEQLTLDFKACVSPKLTVFAMLREDHFVMGVREPACVTVFSRSHAAGVILVY